MIDYVVLKAELQTDPAGLGYAQHLTAGDDVTVALMLNAITGPGAAAIQLKSVSRGTALKGIIPATDSLASGVDLTGAAIPATTLNKWTFRFNALRGGDEQITLDAAFVGMLGQLVTDKLMTQPYIDAWTKRTGSRAEALFGVSVVIGPDDVAKTRSV